MENDGIGITAPRRLARMRVARGDLENCLLAFTAGSGIFEPWLEVVVENAQTGENLYEVVQGFMKDAPCRVLRVTAERAVAEAALVLANDEAEREADDLLANPPGVFARRLDQLPDLTPEDRDALETAFAQLHEMLIDSERGTDPIPAAAAMPLAAPVGIVV